MNYYFHLRFLGYGVTYGTDTGWHFYRTNLPMSLAFGVFNIEKCTGKYVYLTPTEWRNARYVYAECNGVQIGPIRLHKYH